jgi:hypothetical protein
MRRPKAISTVLFLFSILFLAGCAGMAKVAVRPAMQENLSIPAGKIEGNTFTGIRYPFRISAPSGWTMSMEFPTFLKEWGYEPPGPGEKEQTELYLFNPKTQSSVQIDVTPADPYTVFTQEGLEKLVGLGAASLKGELKEEYGQEIPLEIGPTEALALKGVPFAAKKHVTYVAKGIKREQGWIYAFSEPYQIFILYQLLDRNGMSDRQALETILRSFEFGPAR